MASVKITNVENIELNNVKVTYVTGTEKIYQADKLPKTVAAWIEKNMAADEQEQEPEPATEEPARIETVKTTEEPATAEQETIKTEEPKQEPENVPILNVNGTRRTGGLLWDITQYIVYPVAGLMLRGAARIVAILATVAYMLATVAGWIEPRYNRAAAAVKATAGRIRRAAERAWATVKETTLVILENVKAYIVAALEFRRDIIAQDKYQGEF